MMLEFELMIKNEFVPWLRSIFCHHEFDCFVEEITYPKKDICIDAINVIRRGYSPTLCHVKVASIIRIA